MNTRTKNEINVRPTYLTSSSLLHSSRLAINKTNSSKLIAPLPLLSNSFTIFCISRSVGFKPKFLEKKREIICFLHLLGRIKLDVLPEDDFWLVQWLSFFIEHWL